MSLTSKNKKAGPLVEGGPEGLDIVPAGKANGVMC